MAGLDGFVTPTDVVPYPNGEFTVRGISLEDLAQLLYRHRDALDTLFSAAVQEDKKLSLEGIQKMTGAFIASFPDLAAETIALASDSPESKHIALSLPFSVQLDALERIGRLTFVGDYSLKKSLSLITGILEGFNKGVSTVTR